MQCPGDRLGKGGKGMFSIPVVGSGGEGRGDMQDPRVDGGYGVSGVH